MFEWIYRAYYSSEASLPRRVFLRLVRSKTLVRWFFGMRVGENPSGWTGGYWDFTTMALRTTLKRKVREIGDPLVLEIGVGPFAVLAGWVSRMTKQPVEATDIVEGYVIEANRHAEMNRVRVRSFVADVFDGVGEKRYDLVFWNSLYYDDPNGWLRAFFAKLPEYLTDRGQMLLGYNSYPLPRAKIYEILADFPKLDAVEVNSRWWNKNEVFVVRRKPG